MKFNDAITGGALLALALAVLVNVAGFPAIPGQQVGPAVFPGLVALLLAGCALELDNVRPASEIGAPPPPAGTVYAGWRVFQSKCARCHGADAAGATAPDLLPLVRGMSGRRFAGLVLKRYDSDFRADRKSTRLNSSHSDRSRMPSSA